MISWTRSRLSIVLVAVATAGCGATAPARFYTLDSTATTQDAPPVREAVIVGPVSVPASVDRPQFVVQVAPNRVEIDEFNRWAAPLDDVIGRAVAGDLAALLGTPDVAIGSAAGVTPGYRVTLDVQRFESVPSKETIVDVIWVVRASANDAMRTGRTVSREPVSAPDYDALAAAHGRALARVSGDVAVAIRALADAHAASATAAEAATRPKGKAPRSKGQRD